MAYHLAYVPFALHSAERLLCNLEATAREIHRWLRVPCRKLVVICLGFDQDQLRPLDLPRQPFSLVLGRHDHHKNLLRVLQAFARLDSPKLLLKLVGPPNPRRTPELKRLAVELGIAHQCEWIPWVTNETRLTLLNTSIGDTQPLGGLWPALEAMACGTPSLLARPVICPKLWARLGGWWIPPTRFPLPRRWLPSRRIMAFSAKPASLAQAGLPNSAGKPQRGRWKPCWKSLPEGGLVAP